MSRHDAPARLLLVSADPLARAGLAAYFEGRPGVVIAGQADPGELRDALQLAQADALLWDLGADPAQAARQAEHALQRAANVPALLLAPPGTHFDERMAARLAGQGGGALLDRQADAAVIVNALRAALDGLAVIDGRLLPPAEPGLAAGEPPEAVEALTARELDVLRLMAEGLGNKAIAARLGIGESTVKFHVNAILGKLGAQSRTEAVARGTRLGWIKL